MGDIGIFLLIQLGVILLGLGVYLVINLIKKNKKLEDIVQKQNQYLEQMYETIKYTENRIKQIDTASIFQGDDEVGFFFTAVKQLQEQLSEYIKFIK
jgi:hypothetical protein